MAETNSAGTVTTKHQYGPYGEPINQSASRFCYTGQILLPGTALFHYKARVYHPKLGRFLQTDPIGYKHGMNWYEYVCHEPMNAVEPDGTCGTRIKGRASVNCFSTGIKANEISTQQKARSSQEGGTLKYQDPVPDDISLQQQKNVQNAVNIVNNLIKSGKIPKPTNDGYVLDSVSSSSRAFI